MALAALRRKISQAKQMFDNGEIDEGIVFVKEIAIVEETKKRIPSAYNLFVKKLLDEFKASDIKNKCRMSEISHKWKALPQEEKQVFIQQRSALLEEQNTEMKTLESCLTHKNLVQKRFYKRKLPVSSILKRERKLLQGKKSIKEKEKEENNEEITTVKTPEKLENQEIKPTKFVTISKRVKQSKSEKSVKKSKQAIPLETPKQNDEKEDDKEEKEKEDLSPGLPVIVPKWDLYSDDENCEDPDSNEITIIPNEDEDS